MTALSIPSPIYFSATSFKFLKINAATCEGEYFFLSVVCTQASPLSALTTL
jgi:hypothetical protein